MARTVSDGRRTLIALTSALVLIGIGASVTAMQEVASVLTVLALLALIGALHRFGRSGPDAPLAVAKKKKKPV